jgi:hypothetical protein
MAYLIDQRRSPRITCDLPVEYTVRGGPSRAGAGQITNIGTGGGLLTTQGTIPSAGADLGLRFRLPISDRSVQVTATVRWTAPGRAGVAFVSLNPLAQEEIWRYHARVTAGQLEHQVRQRKPRGRRPDRHELRGKVLNAWRWFHRKLNNIRAGPE